MFLCRAAPLFLTSSVQGQNTRPGVKLGPDETAWQVAPYQGQINAVAIDGDGRPATAVGPNGLVLTTKAAVARESEKSEDVGCHSLLESA